jgi:hypothetical protein
VATCRLYDGYISSADGGARWSAPRVVAGPMRLTQLAFAFGFMVGDYEGAAVLPGGVALSAFAVGEIPAGKERLSEPMFAARGGITGGAVPGSTAGAQTMLAPAKAPGVTLTR